MKYNIKMLEEHKTHDDRDLTIYLVDGHRVSLSRTCSYAGSTFGRYFTVRIDGKTIATRCEFYTAQKKAVKYLNEAA